MFVWVELYFGDVPDETGGEDDDDDGSVITPERQFWTRLADAGVLAAPGWFFAPATHTKGGGSASPAGKGDHDHHRVGHLRLSYSLSDVSACILFCDRFLLPFC
jgi:aromatic amino acid aminotransferase I